MPSYIYFKTANLSRYDDRNKVNRPDRGLLEWNAVIVAAKIVLSTFKYNSLLFSNSSLGSRVTLTTPDFVRLCWLGSVNTWISSKISSLSANLIRLRIVRAINHFSGQGASHDWDTLKTGMLSDLIARVGCLFNERQGLG